MKFALSVSILALTLIFAQPALAITGYINYQFYPGDNLFSRNLSVGDNYLSEVMRTAVPEGTTVSLWNPSSMVFDVTSIYSGGSWSIDFQLQAGAGARLTSSSAFLHTFVGDVVNPDGSFYDVGDGFTPPAPFDGPDGIQFLGYAFPVGWSGNDAFLHAVGREPQPGEQIIRLDASTQTYITSTYLGADAWDLLPSLSVGSAAFFNIGGVAWIIPEPSLATLWLLGLALLGGRRFRRTH